MTKTTKQSSNLTIAVIALASIFALAAFIRTYNIFSIPIFADEAIYIRWAQVMKSVSTLRFLPLSDGKQPLFMWIVIPFLKLFSDPLAAGRMVSVVSGLASLVGIFLLTLRLFNSAKSAVVASLLYAVSPFSVFFDRMALADSLLTNFGIWSLYFGILTSQTLRLDFAMLTGFALGGAWLTKSPAMFFLILLPSTLLASNWPKEKFSKVKHFISLFSRWLVSWTIAFGMYNILRLGPEFHMIALRNRDYVFSVSEALKHPLDPFQFHLAEILNWFWILLPGPVLILAVISILFGVKNHLKQILLLLAWLVAPLFVEAEIAKVFTARYILFAVFPMYIFASSFFTVVKLKNSYYLPIILFLVIPALWIDYLLLKNPENAPLPRVERSGYLEEWTAGTGIREIAQQIKSERLKNPDKTIIVGTEGFFGTLPDGLQIYLADLPNVVVKGVGISISSVDSSLVGAKKAGDKVYLVVNSSRFEGKPENMGIQLIKSYPKAQQTNGVRENLMFFEVLDGAVSIYGVKNAVPVKSD